MRNRWSLLLTIGALLSGAPILPVATAADAPATPESSANPAWPDIPALSDSLLLEAPDFETLRPELLVLTTARVAETAWSLVPRLIALERPDLLVGFLEFWEDRCGGSEAITRTRILAAIWDGAFDEGLYDATILDDLDSWEWRDPALLTDGRREFDAFMVSFADQLLPHQDAGSLPEYYCLLYSDRPAEADALLAADDLADTWLRWYVEHPDGAAGGEVVPAGDDGEEVPAGGGPTILLLTVGGWWPLGDVAFAGDHVLVGGLLEQRLDAWFLRLPVEVRLGRTDRPYRVDQDGISGRSDRFDALYLGVEGGRRVLDVGGVALEAFGGLGYDGVHPFLNEDVNLATLNANLGLGVRWQVPDRPVVLGLDARREWLGTRNDGPDSMAGGAWSLRFGVGPRFGPDPVPKASSAGSPAEGSR